jgi:hypothetical protein
VTVKDRDTICPAVAHDWAGSLWIKSLAEILAGFPSGIQYHVQLEILRYIRFYSCAPEPINWICRDPTSLHPLRATREAERRFLALTRAYRPWLPISA